MLCKVNVLNSSNARDNCELILLWHVVTLVSPPRKILLRLFIHHCAPISIIIGFSIGTSFEFLHSTSAAVLPYHQHRIVKSLCMAIWKWNGRVPDHDQAGTTVAIGPLIPFFLYRVKSQIYVSIHTVETGITRKKYSPLNRFNYDKVKFH